MFRLTFLRYLVQNQILNNRSLLQTNIGLKNIVEYKSISSVNLAQKFKTLSLNKRTHNEEPSVSVSEKKNLTDKEYLVQLKNDPDRFGPVQEKEIIDEGDIEEEKYFTEQPSPSQKLRTKQYADIIKELIKQHKIKEAIDIVEVRMLREDRVKPENYLYNLLLGACGRVGYTKKAFKLYNDMKKRGLKVTGGTYTALFNACSNSPFPLTDGLQHATHLRNIMIEKGYEPNDTNYNAMIKAFGRCGDLPTAFTLADEMYSKGFKIKDDTINFLLQACITDKETGFRHALLVWRKLVTKRIRPSVYTYNLLLRCIRDCGLGDIEVTQDVINKILSNNNKHLQKPLKNNNIESNTGTILLTTETNQDENSAIEPVKSEETQLLQRKVGIEAKNLRPDLIGKVPHLGSLISLSEVKKPEERLLLVGGFSGFLENMSQNECSPDIKTFTQLLDSIPSTVAAEQELLSAMKSLSVKPDIDFYNMLIKKRSMRYDFESAKEVLLYMKKHRYKPNLITYGVLALSCKNEEEAVELINEMESKSYVLNIEILGAMLHQACFHKNISYVLKIMEKCVTDNINPSKKFMSTLGQFIRNCKKSLNSMKLTKSQEKSFGILKSRYKTWRREIQVDESEDVHPWQQFKENSQDGKYYKWKDGARFKPRHNSRFRVKTSTKHRN